MKVHEPTEKDRKTVETMASHGITEIDIAKVIGISDVTLRKWYRQELDTAHIKANSAVAGSLFEKAMGTGSGAVTACIFWLKCRAKWVEPTAQQVMPGRKELQQQAAATASVGTEWAADPIEPAAMN